jgi:hypothetical protein
MRRLLLAILLVALLLANELLVLLLPWPSPVTRAACKQIQPGMSRREVEAIFGVSAGSYATRPGIYVLRDRPRGARKDRIGDCWMGDDGMVEVRFIHGMVWDVVVTEPEPDHTGYVERMLWRVKHLNVKQVAWTLRWLRQRCWP